MWSGAGFWCVHAALKLNVFETIADGAVTADQLATRLDADPKGITILLGTLHSLRYLKQFANRYRNSAMTNKWLRDSGSVNFSPLFMYWGAILQHFMPHLADSIRSGNNSDFYGWIESQPEVSRHFQQGMVQLARFVAEDVARAVKVPVGAARLLDIGGGHGEYAIAFCKKQPLLSAVVLDSEQALVTGQATIAQAGFGDRITTHAANFMTDDLPTGFDMVLAFNIVHGLKPADNIDLFRKLKDTLNPGGQIVVLEQVHNVTPLPLTNVVSHILSMTYYNLLGGQVYTYDDIKAWLSETGFQEIRRKSILKASSILVSAVKS